MHYEAKAAHLGGNLSCLDILMTLYHDVLKPEDVFILSKGHSAGALYVTLWSKGLLSDDDLKTFHGEGTSLPGHAPLGGGSLGHGLSIAAGVALGKKLQGQPGRVYCLCSDGEMEEGQSWEAAMFAVHHRLDNLVFMVDGNQRQGYGPPRTGYAGIDDWLPVDGHNPDHIMKAATINTGSSRGVLFSTLKGRYVSFLEDRHESHYTVLTHDQYEQAMKELV